MRAEAFARVQVVALSWVRAVAFQSVPALDPADEEGGAVRTGADGSMGGASIWCVARMWGEEEEK